MNGQGAQAHTRDPGHADGRNGANQPRYDHGHAPGPADERRLFWTLLLTGGFMVAEVVGGLLSGSLALLADAGHMLTDTAALGLAWYAARLALRPAGPRRSYGHHRAEVLAAFVNGSVLLGLSAWIAVEAVRRLFEPVQVLGGTLLVIAGLGLVVNVAAFLILQGGSQENLNIRGAALHVLGDLAGSVAAVVAGVVILTTGWMPVDPLLSILVSVLIARSAYRLARGAGHILMEGAPEGIDPGEIASTLPSVVAGVTDVHHVHLWSLTPNRPLVTLHAVLGPGADHDQALADVRAALRDRFGLDHATVQLERTRCDGLE